MDGWHKSSFDGLNILVVGFVLFGRWSVWRQYIINPRNIFGQLSGLNSKVTDISRCLFRCTTAWDREGRQLTWPKKTRNVPELFTKIPIEERKKVESMFAQQRKNFYCRNAKRKHETILEHVPKSAAYRKEQSVIRENSGNRKETIKNSQERKEGTGIDRKNVF